MASTHSFNTFSEELVGLISLLLYLCIIKYFIIIHLLLYIFSAEKEKFSGLARKHTYIYIYICKQKIWLNVIYDMASMKIILRN